MNKKARQENIERQEAASRENARTQPRAPSADIPEVGRRRLQLLVVPSSGASHAWEIRQQDDRWMLYRSQVLGESLDVHLVGYDPVPADGKMLGDFFREVTALTLPLEPELRRSIGVDGTMTQLAVFGSMYSECRFQWWSKGPPQWEPLTRLADRMAEAFLKL